VQRSRRDTTETIVERQVPTLVDRVATEEAA